MKENDIKKLIEIAIQQLPKAYVPYSNYRVGAALLAKNGTILAVILKMLRIPRVIVQSVQHFLKQSVKR